MRLIRLGFIFVLLSTSLALMVPVSAQEDAVPRFESALCPFETPDLPNLECGYLIVPEDRTDPAPNSPTIRLAVAILRATEANAAPDPLIYLDGGPGSNSLASYGSFFGDIFAPLAGNRDIIIFDQRGMGFSEPSLDCPEYQEEYLGRLDEQVSDAEAFERESEALLACRSRAIGETNLNITAYNSFENAADVNDLRLALGYEQVNLLGISYGTRLALTVMRDHPEGLRSVILDSVVPLQTDMGVQFIGNADRAFQGLFDACAADEACKTAYPDLEKMLYNTAAELDINPIEAEVFVDGQTYPILFDGVQLFILLFQSMYASSIIPNLPQLIQNISVGNLETALNLYGFFLSDSVSEGANYSFNCYEDIPFTSDEALIASYAAYPELSKYLGTEDLVYELGLAAFCQEFVGAVSPQNAREAVVSDIPTLVMAGQLDPITPPSLAELAAETLTNATYIEIPYAGHGPSLDGGCPSSIAATFIDDPTTVPDTSCTEGMLIEFPTPLSEVTLIDYSNADLGLESLIPQDWNEFETGIFYRYNTTNAPFMGYRLPEDGLEGYTERIIQGGYGYEELPEPTDTLETEVANWTIYQITGQGLFTYFAFTEIDGQAYVTVVAGNTEAERDFMYDNILLPALEAFTLIN